MQKSWSEGTGADFEAVYGGLGTYLTKSTEMEILSFCG